MVENLYLANGVTWFAVPQSLAFLFGLGRAGFLKAISNVVAQGCIIAGTIVFAVAYSMAVWKCWALAAPLDGHRSEQGAVWAAVTWGRVACIAAVLKLAR